YPPPRSQPTRATAIYTLSLHDALPIFRGECLRPPFILVDRHGPVPYPKLLHYCAHRPRQVDPGGPPHRAYAGRLSAGDARSDSRDRKSTRLNSSHVKISYAVFCLKKKI